LGASNSPAGIISPSNRSDSPDRAGSFDDRFGSWASSLAGNSSDASSPLLRRLQELKRSSLPDAPAAPSTAVANGSLPSIAADDRRYLARVVNGKMQSVFDTTAPAVPFVASAAPPDRPLGLVSGMPMPQWPVRPSIFDFPDRSGSSRDGSDSDDTSQSPNSQGTGIPVLDDYIRYLNQTYGN
jgi:hypothetical protein